MIEVVGLFVYPVKGLRGTAVETAKLHVRGLESDRLWMITDSSYRFLTQREFPKMATIDADIQNDVLTLSHYGDSIDVPSPQTDVSSVEVTIWKDTCFARDAGDDVSDWLSAILGTSKGKPLRLVGIDDSHRRLVDATYLKGEESYTGFADGFPYLVTTLESVADLNHRLDDGQEVTMDRFRPNIVVRGCPAWTEFRLDALACSEANYTLGMRKPSKRCSVLTVDQVTGVISNPKEPLATLARLAGQLDQDGATFGMNATLVAGVGETISVGDLLDATW